MDRTASFHPGQHQSIPQSYLQTMNTTPLLTADEEKELARQIGAGDAQARDRLVRANLRLVINIARGYAGKGLNLDDLIQEGNLGLMHAVEGFDPGRNTRFSTYAGYWIKQSIRRALFNQARPIRLPAYMIGQLTKWRRATAQLNDSLGREPTTEEVAASLKLSRKKLAILKNAIQTANLIPQTVKSSDDPHAPGHLLIDHQSRPPLDGLVNSDDLKQVYARLAAMDQRQALVIRMRFGLDDATPRTLQEIGHALSLTRERVRQLEAGAMRSLSQALC